MWGITRRSLWHRFWDTCICIHMFGQPYVLNMTWHGVKLVVFHVTVWAAGLQPCVLTASFDLLVSHLAFSLLMEMYSASHSWPYLVLKFVLYIQGKCKCRCKLACVQARTTLGRIQAKSKHWFFFIYILSSSTESGIQSTQVCMMKDWESCGVIIIVACFTVLS